MFLIMIMLLILTLCLPPQLGLWFLGLSPALFANTSISRAQRTRHGTKPSFHPSPAYKHYRHLVVDPWGFRGPKLLPEGVCPDRRQDLWVKLYRFMFAVLKSSPALGVIGKSANKFLKLFIFDQ